MKKLFAVIIFLFSLSTAVFAQTAEGDFHGYIVDSYTRKAIEGGVKIKVMLQDSTLVTNVTVNAMRDDFSDKAQTRFSIRAPKSEKKFILRLEHPNYETTYKDINLEWKMKMGSSEYVGSLTMKHKIIKADWEKDLEDVTITATKIKFYSKGDTLIYNADAFMLQDGSMLDALIEQLPGVELKDDGRIYVNGRFVESLMLNGKDFFKGDNSVLLDNLPGYMVKDIQVYEKESDRSKIAKTKVDDGIFVMDVKLKKEYSIGYLGNAEAGAGSEKRYLGKLFLSRFTNQSRVSLFGNINNVNARRKPDGNGNWSDIDPSGGLTATKRGGLDYAVDDKFSHWSIKGNVDVNYNDNENSWNGLTEYFYASGNTFDITKNKSDRSNLSVSTNHELKLTGEDLNYIVKIAPRFSYSENDYTNTMLMGTYGMNPDTDNMRLLDSLFSDNWENRNNAFIKRNGQWSKGNGNSYNAGADFALLFKNPYSNDFIDINGNISYTEQESDGFNHFIYNHLQGDDMAQDYRNRHSSYPARRYNASVRAKYFWHYTENSMLSPGYVFSYNYSDAESMHYRLDYLAEAESMSLGWLPDYELLMTVLDHNNSYTAEQKQSKHTFQIDWQYNHYVREPETRKILSRFHVGFIPSLVYERNTLNYNSTPHVQTARFNKLHPKIDLSATLNTMHYKHEIRFMGNIYTSTPYLLYLVDRINNNDPLNITMSNPGLKGSTTFSSSLNYRSDKWLQERDMTLSAAVGFSATRNQVTICRTYDKATGVTTTRPENINGAWDGWASTSFSMPLDKAHRLTMRTSTSLYHWHMVDYSSSTDAPPERTKTNSSELSENLDLTYRRDKVKITASGNISWNHVTSDITDYETVNTISYRYGLNAMIGLPFDFQISSGMTMYSRRGYESNSMNSDDLVWNARLSKSLFSGRLQIMADAWDILGNLSNKKYGVNGVRRIEHYYNTIPRYIMMRVIYKMNIEPKKRGVR